MNWLATIREIWHAEIINVSAVIVQFLSATDVEVSVAKRKGNQPVMSQP
jgi:hypothetical protein